MTTIVKPLEWHGNNAQSLGLEYHVWWYSIGSKWLAGSGIRGIGDGYSSAEEAKAAAQSDYEARILSALAPQAGDNAEEPVAWRWSFDGGVSWSHGPSKHGSFRFGDPDITEPLYSHPCTSTPVVSQNAPDLEDKGGEA